MDNQLRKKLFLNDGRVNESALESMLSYALNEILESDKWDENEHDLTGKFRFKDFTVELDLFEKEGDSLYDEDEYFKYDVRLIIDNKKFTIGEYHVEYLSSLEINGDFKPGDINQLTVLLEE